MTYEEFGKYDISQYIYENRDSIPIINTVKITDYNWGRIDIIINQFCNNDITLLPILFDFNKISNPFDMKINNYINIPDFNYILMNTQIKDIENKKIPGVNQSMNCNDVNRLLSTLTKDNSTTGASKLGALKKVSYNSETGIITY